MKKLLMPLLGSALMTGCTHTPEQPRIKEIVALTSTDDIIEYCVVEDENKKTDTLVMEIFAGKQDSASYGDLRVTKTERGKLLELTYANKRYISEGTMDDVEDAASVLYKNIKITKMNEFAAHYFDLPGKPQRGGPRSQQTYKPVFTAFE